MIKKILISQPKPSNEKSPYFDIEKEFGVQFVFRPFFKVEALTAKEFRQQKVSILAHTAIVFTSRHAIDYFFSLAKELRITIPEDMKYFCVTETISLYIQKYVQYRKRKVFFGNTGRIDDLIPIMLKHKAEKYLVPQSSVHTDEIKEKLDAKELNHTECVMYRTHAYLFYPNRRAISQQSLSRFAARRLKDCLLRTCYSQSRSGRRAAPRPHGRNERIPFHDHGAC